MSDPVPRNAEMHDPAFWDSHCWADRFLDAEDSPPCLAPAQWQGPPNSTSKLVRAWRACDKHALASDVRMGSRNA